jgi:hypothetical protein
MKLDSFVAVSGLPGLFKLINTRSNGIIVSDPDTGKTRFVSVRQHQFTPLATVGIYTFDDTVELTKVFGTMMEQSVDNPVIDIRKSSDEIRNYFSKILPDHDPDKVHISDIKKIIKWYDYLNTRGLLNEDISEEE